jgi:hypothetical protein
MSITLFDLTYKLARLLGTVSEGVATGGSTTTIADTVERTEDNDYWIGGTAWILYDAAGAGAAPQGEYSYISDFATTGGIITLRSTLTAAVAASDRYAVASPRYPLQILTQKINESFGVMIKTDITSLTTVSGQTEYSLPTDLLELRQVYIARDTNTVDHRWERIYDWDVEKTAVSTADKLILMREFTAGYLIKLVYTTYQATLRFATDVLDEWIHEDYVLYNAAVGCLLWRKAKVGDSDLSVNDLLNYYQALASQKNLENQRRLPSKTAKTIHPVF